MSSITFEDACNVGNSMSRLYTKCNDTGTNYVKHVYKALTLSCQLGLGSFYFCVHAVCPSLFEKDAADVVSSVYYQLYPLKLLKQE